ncbi:MAG: MerR family transcriptional regulator [Massiliimalia sp.]|jgi:DNA-binding transcriptional MerR regulator
MEKQFYIGEISQFFNLPASTLRYWEEAEILTPHKNAANSYREYSAADFMTLSDIIFYKSLGIPLKQIRLMKHSEPEEHELLFHHKIQQLTYEQEQIQQRIQKLQCHLEAIRILKELKEHPYEKTDIDTDCIVSFDLIEMKKLQKYMENPYLYSRVQHSDHPEEESRGLTIPLEQIHLFPDSEILWKKSRSTYIACLMKEEVTDGFPNNLPEILQQIQKNYRTGFIISRFLLRAQEDGTSYDFYKTFVEILP